MSQISWASWKETKEGYGSLRQPWLPSNLMSSQGRSSSGGRTGEMGKRGEEEASSGFQVQAAERRRGRENDDREQRQPGSTTATDANGNTAARIRQVAPAHRQGIHTSSTHQNQPAERSLAEKLWTVVFFAHLLAVIVLITFLAIRGFIAQDHGFHPKHWHLPLLASIGCSVAAAIAWVLLTVKHHPQNAITAALWFAPLLSFAVGVLLFNTGTGTGLAFASLSVVFAIVQSLYACWIASRLEHAAEILQASRLAIQPANGILKFTSIAVVYCFLFSGLWVLGIGGVMAHETRFGALYITILLLSLAWTMQVIRNVIHVAISHVAYIHLAYGLTGIHVADVLNVTYRSSMGSICLGSVFVPVTGVLRGLARTLKLVAGDTDEFLFSCASCFMGVANWLMTCGNRWGFVHVGVYQKGFIDASGDVWQFFMRADMGALIDSDLTSSFCFMSGVAGGMLCALVSGIWTMVIDKNYTTAISIYAFLVGYFMVRVVMALPQACVSAYHVVYAENPQNPRVNQIIPRRIREMQW